MTGSEVVVDVAGQTLHLLPEKAAYWADQRTLLIADAHWGKAATFRSAGLPVPRGTTRDSLRRLDHILGRYDAPRIVFLGDLLHARQGRAKRTLDAVREWRETHAGVEMILVRGNHDRSAGDPPEELDIRCVDEPMDELPGFLLAHFPRHQAAGYSIAGHLHPAVRLIGKGRQRARLPCFWIQSSLAILPAFGDFTGAAVVEPSAGDRIFVVTGEEVLEIGR